MTVLTGHTSPETAYVVADYPYGFRLRCQIRYWIETTKHGQRVVSQTTNPKKPGIVWNKPKASTYTELRVLFIDPITGYVENAGLSVYADTAKVNAFEVAYGASLTDAQQRTLTAIKSMAARMDEREARRQAAQDAGTV